MKTRARPFVVVAAVLLAASCSKNEPVEPEPAANGGAPGVKTDAAANGAATACPQDLPGPKLIPLPAKSGSVYCMDQRETTWNEYKAFADSKGSDTSGQPDRCAWNESFMPAVRAPGDDTSLAVECKDWEELQSNGDGPAFCVDFCDAWAYCAWAGKRLCRETDSAADTPTVVPFEQAQANASSTNSEWTNACTQGGKTKYSYGDEKVEGQCIDKHRSPNITALEQSSCHGTLPPFNEVYDLDGSVLEWVDSCNGNSCATRGTSPYLKEEATCTSATFVSEFEQGRAFGIRCCADAVAAKPSETPTPDAGK